MNDARAARCRRAPGLAGVAALSMAVFLAACASPVPVRPARLEALAASAVDLEIKQDTAIRLSTGYQRMLPAGSRWQAVGLLPEGVVYRPRDIVFAIEGRQVHEAYMVVRSSAVQGFYLPAEGNFSPLTPPIPLP